MSKTLVWFACPGVPSAGVVAKYREALSVLGDYELQWISVKGLSSAFVRFADANRDATGRIVPNLMAKLGIDGGARPARVMLVCYSAGYALARSLLLGKLDAASLDAVVLIDALHAGLDHHGRPSESALQPFASYAGRAKARDAILYVGHSDVPTYGYASTTQSSRRLESMAEGQGGNFVIRSYDVAKAAKEEHAMALTQWGPGLVKEAAERMGLRVATPVAPAVVKPWRDPTKTLGERCVEFSYAEMHADVKEEPLGSNTSPRIREYLDGGMRDGAKLGLTSGAWCAAAACFAMQSSLLPGEKPIHPWRVSGVEMMDDARDGLKWRPKHLVGDGGWWPMAGDLVVLHRGTKGSWTRHVARVVTPPDNTGAYLTIGGNEADRWGITSRTLNDSSLYGFIEYPRR